MTPGEATQFVIQILNTYLLPISAVIISLVLVLFVSRKKIRQFWLGRKALRSLKRLGFKRMVNFKCPDGLGYHYIIDHLILRHDGISLLLYKRYPGKIYCADDIDQWTQMLGQKSYRFDNPLYDLDCQIKAISECVPNIPINGYLFFDHLAEFPKGRPDRVFQLKEIPEELKPTKKAKVEKNVMAAWKKLQSMA